MAANAVKYKLIIGYQMSQLSEILLTIDKFETTSINGEKNYFPLFLGWRQTPVLYKLNK